MKIFKEDYNNTRFIGKVCNLIINFLESGDVFDVDDELVNDNVDASEGKCISDIDSDGVVYISIYYMTYPIYSYTSGYFPSNEKAEEIFNNVIDYNLRFAKETLWDNHKKELIKLGITSKDDEKINYNDLFDMGAIDLADEFQQYEFYDYGLDFDVHVSCELEEIDKGIVEMSILMSIVDQDTTVANSYKPNTVLLRENDKNLEKTIEDAIKKVTYQF